MANSSLFASYRLDLEELLASIKSSCSAADPDPKRMESNLKEAHDVIRSMEVWQRSSRDSDAASYISSSRLALAQLEKDWQAIQKSALLGSASGSSSSDSAPSSSRANPTESDFQDGTQRLQKSSQKLKEALAIGEDLKTNVAPTLLSNLAQQREQIAGQQEKVDRIDSNVGQSEKILNDMERRQKIFKYRMPRDVELDRVLKVAHN